MHLHTRTGGKQFVRSIRSELSTNSTWMYGSFDSWHYGCMAVWIHGTMDAWQFGFMAQWIYGSLDSSPRCDGLDTRTSIHLKLRLRDRIYFPGGCMFHSLLCGLL